MSTAKLPTSSRADDGRFQGGARITLVEGTRHPNPELARVMGTSVRMIERHYGTLLTGAAAGIASRLAAFEAAQDEANEAH